MQSLLLAVSVAFEAVDLVLVVFLFLRSTKVIGVIQSSLSDEGIVLDCTDAVWVAVIVAHTAEPEPREQSYVVELTARFMLDSS